MADIAFAEAEQYLVGLTRNLWHKLETRETSCLLADLSACVLRLRDTGPAVRTLARRGVCVRSPSHPQVWATSALRILPHRTSISAAARYVKEDYFAGLNFVHYVLEG